MPEAFGTFQFVADRGDARSRLDRVLVRRLSGLSRFSRTRAQEWIACGSVTVDGIRATRAAMRVAEGAAVGVTLPDSAHRKSRPQSEPVPLTVLYEDRALMVVNKPAGMTVHPSYKRTSGTLLNAVLWHLRWQDQPRPGIVTRLDKDTSGLVLIALTGEVHAALQHDAPQLRKEYLAIVRGWPRPPRGRIRHPLARDPFDRRRVVVAPGGAASETRYELVDRRESASGRESLVRCELLTGRTHQIRVHLAAQGWPVVGDATYGCSDERIPRQALHAWRLAFTHPVTKQPIDLEAPIPEDMLALVR
ncbi:MAG TPA: RluA family pseudouridine synthase [Vicinamibacterales bacterium]|nr:RluA family pseudouridine synthase [Vicinamibacterales bacterium]